MVTRRVLLEMALALAVLPRPAGAQSPAPRGAGAVSAPDALAPDTFIFDTRFAASVAAAREAAARRIRVRGIDGDVTALWYHDLYFRWRRGPAVTAGMTGEDSLFCLDLLARDAGLRVLDLGDPAGGLVSWVIGPKRAPARAA